jgi:hypothetical protein
MLCHVTLVRTVVPPKHWFLQQPHGVTSHKMAIFILKDVYQFFMSVLSILRLRESGILNILMIRHPSHFWKQQQGHNHPSSKFEGSVQLLQVAPILSLYTLAIMLALLVLMVERALSTQT